MTKKKVTKENTETDEEVVEKKEDIEKDTTDTEKPETKPKKEKKTKKVKKEEEVPDYIKIKQDSAGNFLDVPNYLETSEKKSKYPDFLK